MLDRMPIDLDGGLTMRFAETGDAERLAEFHARVHEDELVGVWVRRLVEGKHPTFKPSDFALIEDTSNGKIASSMCSISQTWTYGGIPFGVGRPEIVGTDPDYRRRGLVKAQFDLFHELSASRGEMWQVITGIPWFYCQFGYEMAMVLGGSRIVEPPNFPAAPDPPTCRLREPTTDDHEFIRALVDRATTRVPIRESRDDALWEYEFDSGRHYGNVGTSFLVIESNDGRRVGFVQHQATLDGERFNVVQMELREGVSYLNVMPSLIHALWERAQRMIASGAHPRAALDGINFNFGRNHPSYVAFDPHRARIGTPYSWYVRVADVLGFLNHIRPALERNLIGSPAEGYSGEVKVSFYTNGVKIALDHGQITTIEDWCEDGADARFPDQTFLHLLCGQKRCAEIRQMTVACSVRHEAGVVLDSLFPPQDENLAPIQ
ncbi:MAG: GNAT family N-acetyltransferase [Candidatus Poribacteria bacterium]|nr:GNAT family N-acetyltransferase [Candidatus Poribacteria bacterium]